MKRLTFLSIIAMALVCVSCYPTRIVTVSPDTTYGHSTTVSYPNHSTTEVIVSDYDLCLHLDLQAVGAAFAQAYTVREFEQLLNSPNYMISNLDLNRDGYIDYLRVVEAVNGFTHMFVIQAVLGRNIFQDVATLVVENPSYAGTYVEIIGAPFLYGPKYIVRPIYSIRPNIYAHLTGRYYSPWSSPWYWDNFPTYYKRPAPMHLSHYQAYVDTYMHNHRFCHEVMYPSSYHYADYNHMTQHIQRNDYGTQHPEQSFVNRTANAAGENSAIRRASNARDIQQAQAATRKANTATTATNSRTASTSTSTATRANSTSSASRSSVNANNGASAARSASTNNNTSATRSSAATNNNASASRSSATTNNNTTATRSSSTSSNNASASRSSAATNNNNTTATRSASTGTASRSSQAATKTTTGETTVSRVSSSGAARTTTSSGTANTAARRSSSSDNGSTATKSTTSTSSSSATRSGSSTSASRSAGTSSTATRSSSSSTGSASTSSTSTTTRGRR